MSKPPLRLVLAGAVLALGLFAVEARAQTLSYTRESVVMQRYGGETRSSQWYTLRQGLGSNPATGFSRAPDGSFGLREQEIQTIYGASNNRSPYFYQPTNMLPKGRTHQIYDPLYGYQPTYGTPVEPPAGFTEKASNCPDCQPSGRLRPSTQFCPDCQPTPRSRASTQFCPDCR